ncbi:MAG: phosphotransferase [Parachlamydiaceae bacterium]|nr:phosphotransferase [Parachlamydiaceae bacterium]
MNIKSFVVIIFLLSAALIAQIGSIFAEKCLLFKAPFSSITSPKKTLVDPLVIKEYVEHNFAITESVTTEVLNIGVNDIYLVEVGSQKYVLRLSRADKNLTLTDSSFLFELAWLEFLNDHEVPVSFPIRRTDKQLFGIINASEGSRYATLFSFAEGTTDLNEEQAFILGKSLAQLHVVSDDFKIEIERGKLDIDELITQSVNQIQHFLNFASPADLLILDEFAEKLREEISKVDRLNGSYGIIAGDIHGYNQHFTKNNQLTMFDFEFCSYGYRAYDIATFRWSRGSNNTELWNTFLDGYQSIRKLHDSELEAIEAFVQARNLWWISSFSKMPEYLQMFDDDFWKSVFTEFKIYLLS